MKLQEAIKLMSPLDVLCLTLETKGVVRKNDENFQPGSLLAGKVEKLISIGDHPTRNPTYWNVSGGTGSSEVPNWKDLLISELEASPSFNVKLTDLDNNSNVMEVSCEISLLVINCNNMGQELMKDVKCARIRTVFGSVDVEL